MKSRNAEQLFVNRRSSPESSLWASVIGQAFCDALCRISEQGQTSPDDSRKARNWLLYDQEDFYEVCSAAGVVPSAVRAKAQELLS